MDEYSFINCFIPNYSCTKEVRNSLHFFIDVFIELSLRTHQCFTGFLNLKKIRRFIIFKYLLIHAYDFLNFIFYARNKFPYQ